MTETVYKIDYDGTYFYISTYIAPFNINNLRCYRYNIANGELMVNNGDGQFINNWADRLTVNYSNFDITNIENYNIKTVLDYIILYRNANIDFSTETTALEDILGSLNPISLYIQSKVIPRQNSIKHIFSNTDTLILSLDALQDDVTNVEGYTQLTITNLSSNCSIKLFGVLPNSENSFIDITKSGYVLNTNSMCPTTFPNSSIIDWDGINLSGVQLEIIPVELPAVLDIGWRLK